MWRARSSPARNPAPAEPAYRACYGNAMLSEVGRPEIQRRHGRRPYNHVYSLIGSPHIFMANFISSFSRCSISCLRQSLFASTSSIILK